MKRFVLGEFGEPEACVVAVRRLRAQGVPELDAYSPFPLHGIDEALELPRSKVPLVALTGGVLGAGAGYLMQWWMNGINYPINVGNRPPHGFWTNIPITFETGVLISAFAIFFGLWLLLGLPRPYHPVFEVEAFRSASRDGFWLSVEAEQPSLGEKVAERLRLLGARQVSIVSEQS